MKLSQWMERADLPLLGRKIPPSVLWVMPCFMVHPPSVLWVLLPCFMVHLPSVLCVMLQCFMVYHPSVSVSIGLVPGSGEHRVLETIAPVARALRVSAHLQTTLQRVQSTLFLLAILFALFFFFELYVCLQFFLHVFNFQFLPLNFIFYFYALDWNNMCSIVFKWTGQGFQPRNSVFI